MNTNRKYIILDAGQEGIVEFSTILETSVDTLTYKLDGSKFFVKYEGAKPRWAYGINTLTHEEMRTELNNIANGWRESVT